MYCLISNVIVSIFVAFSNVSDAPDVGGGICCASRGAGLEAGYPDVFL